LMAASREFDDLASEQNAAGSSPSGRRLLHPLLTRGHFLFVPGGGLTVINTSPLP